MYKCLQITLQIIVLIVDVSGMLYGKTMYTFLNIDQVTNK